MCVCVCVCVCVCMLLLEVGMGSSEYGFQSEDYHKLCEVSATVNKTICWSGQGEVRQTKTVQANWCQIVNS